MIKIHNFFVSLWNLVKIFIWRVCYDQCWNISLIGSNFEFFINSKILGLSIVYIVIVFYNGSARSTRFEFWAVALAVEAAAALLRNRRSRFTTKLSPQIYQFGGTLIELDTHYCNLWLCSWLMFSLMNFTHFPFGYFLKKCV